MKKQLIVAAGILVMLGAAVSGAFGDNAPAAPRANVGAVKVDAPNATQMLAKLNAVPASVPLARPL